LKRRSYPGLVGWRAARRALALFVLASAAGALASGGCAQEPIEVEVRSLERSGRVAFVCLGDPATGASAARPPIDCQLNRTETPNDYSLPHLYALVTQTTRGEVAVIDLTTDDDAVIDQDTRVPGANFLPVGAQPVDIAATPGGSATFVAVAEVGRRGIFALPSNQIRPASRNAPPTLSSWPACALPSAPGSILVATDDFVPNPDPKADEGSEIGRARCDDEYDTVVSADTTSNPDTKGSLKLIVTLPDEGGFAIIDGEDLLARPPGSFDVCAIERWVPLSIELATPPLPREEPPTLGCVQPATPDPEPATYTARPAGMALSDGRLFIADLEAPVIHVVDLPTPCDPIERPSLLPSSAEEPERVVTTSRVAVSPGLTTDYKKFLYAVDYMDGSVMVFDVSEGESASRQPLHREQAQENPFSPRDRIRFAPPVRDIAIVERDIPAADATTGAAQTGVLCDPDPNCTPTSGSCPPQAPLYRTSSNYESGAGPEKIRGMFAYLLLSSGELVVVDIEDYDAPCRGPRVRHPIFGCDAYDEKDLKTSGEVSCDVVIPHTPRNASFFISNDEAGRHQPGLQSTPLLFDSKGSLLQFADDPGIPWLRATVPEGGLPDKVALTLAVGGAVQVVDNVTGFTSDEEGADHSLAMNFDDPHAHVTDQVWAIIFEGALPGFVNRFAELRIGTGGDEEGLFDATSRFCDAGVQSQAAVRELLGDDASEDEVARLADRVQIASEIPADSSAHWQVAACGFEQCRATFGAREVPKLQRDLRVVEAYQDRLVLADSDSIEPPVTDELIKCCFPGVVSFNVRAGNQWLVVGQASGLLHHMIPDPETGACRPSCDPVKSLLNGRLRTSPGGDPVVDADPALVHPLVGYVDDNGVRRFPFKNPMFRFAITECVDPDECGEARRPDRGVQFQFQSIGKFESRFISLTGDTGEIAPQAITPVPASGRLAVTDGTLEGLLIVSPERLDVVRSYF
jgi:hypothetical protein